MIFRRFFQTAPNWTPGHHKLYVSWLDGSSRNPIYRLHFNSDGRKYLGLFNEEGNHDRFEIGSIDDIYEYVERLKATAQRYAAPAPVPSESSEQ